MKKLLMCILLAFCLILSGCLSGLYEKVPNVEFEHFSYVRGGNFSSANIEANGATLGPDGMIVIDNLMLNENWGPFVNFTIHLKGYKRKLE